MNRKRIVASVVLMLALVASLAVLAACSQPQQSSSSKETLEVSDQVSKMESEDPFYVLIIGNDSRKGTTEINKRNYADGTGRSDTIMMARVDPRNYQITLLTIPRDTQDTIDGTNVKINERYRQQGAEGLMDAVEGLTGVRPKYYISTTFVGFEDLVDKMGGLKIYVPYDQSMTDIVSGKKIEFSAGEQELNGAETLVLARERKKYNSLSSIGGEPYRQSNDRVIVETMIKQILSNASTAGDVTRSLLTFCETNWDTGDLVATVEYFADGADKLTFQDGTGPYEGDIDATTGEWLAYRDEDTWSAIIAKVEEGGDPKEIVPVLSLYE